MSSALTRRELLKNSLITTAAVGFTIGAADRTAVVYAADEPAGKEPPEEGFVALFNGKDLTGWEGDPKLWLAENGMLIGRSAGIGHNDFLATTKTYRDFILRFQVRLVDGKGNSGVQFRSQRVPPPSHEVSGYQADIAAGWWGKLYDESRRGKVLAGPPPEVLQKILKPADWNDYEVTAVGDHITLSLNGVKTVDYTEPDPKIPRDGILATQIHSGGPMEAQFRRIRIKEVKAGEVSTRPR